MSKQDWERLKANSPVRIQWDPERDLHLQALPYRGIQIGIGGEAVPLYVRQWVRKIADVTDLAHRIHDLVAQGRLDQARAALPVERVYHGLFGFSEFCLTADPNQQFNPIRPTRHEGRFAIVTDAVWDAVDAARATDERTRGGR